jgi:hypothetical protein
MLGLKAEGGRAGRHLGWGAVDAQAKGDDLRTGIGQLAPLPIIGWADAHLKVVLGDPERLQLGDGSGVERDDEVPGKGRVVEAKVDPGEVGRLAAVTVEDGRDLAPESSMRR